MDLRLYDMNGIFDDQLFFIVSEGFNTQEPAFWRGSLGA
jgi:hypothetical protein